MIRLLIFKLFLVMSAIFVPESDLIANEHYRETSVKQNRITHKKNCDASTIRWYVMEYKEQKSRLPSESELIKHIELRLAEGKSSLSKHCSSALKVQKTKLLGSSLDPVRYYRINDSQFILCIPKFELGFEKKRMAYTYNGNKMDLVGYEVCELLSQLD